MIKPILLFPHYSPKSESFARSCCIETALSISKALLWAFSSLSGPCLKCNCRKEFLPFTNKIIIITQPTAGQMSSLVRSLYKDEASQESVYLEKWPPYMSFK